MKGSTEPDSSSPFRGKRSLRFLVLTLILVAILISAGIVYYEFYLLNTNRLHVGVVTLNQMEDFTELSLQSSVNNSLIDYPFLLQSTVGMYAVQDLGQSQSLALPIVTIYSLEFLSSSNASYFYNTTYHSLNEILQYQYSEGGLTTFATWNVSYSSFKIVIFNYSQVYTNGVNYTSHIAIGYNGKFSFEIIDFKIPLTSFNSLVKAEIHSMTHR